MSENKGSIAKFVVILILIAVVMILVKYAATVFPVPVANVVAGPTIIIDDTTYFLETQSTPESRVRGLSGRESLSETGGMLFVFETPGDHGFWMKEMHFPISIIWLDETCKVTGFKREATPESYPEVFYPVASSTYVVEILPIQRELSIGETLSCKF